MRKSLPKESALPPNLRLLVKESAALLGSLVKKEAGQASYRTVERLRRQMVSLRDQAPIPAARLLRKELLSLRKLSTAERHTVAKAFTFFLELMNAAENAYRSYRLRGDQGKNPVTSPHRLVYVLTAHPTEARAPGNIAVFREIQALLTAALAGENPSWREDLHHQLELAWRAYPTRQRAPKVKDEAAHIYGTALAEETLRPLLEQRYAPLYLRTWVGGDKDGHPGVNAATMKTSLGLSRQYLLRFIRASLGKVQASLELLPSSPLLADFSRLKRSLPGPISPGDGVKAMRFHESLRRFSAAYEKKIGAIHPELRLLKRLLHIFPALVVPLELRESSDMLNEAPIRRMLEALHSLSRGADPLWYARGLIISMTEKTEHLVAAERLVKKTLGGGLPVIPLFETVSALEAGPGILKDFFRGRNLSQMEIMVGYSDSSKQGGVLPSRVAIAEAMHELERVCLKAKVKPIFFQGSGGSVDRGGGSVEDQVAWWPRSALETYKVTVQGEMVERSFSSPEITRGQTRRIVESVSRALKKRARAPSSPALDAFADKVRIAYQKKIHEPDFLTVIGQATPYRFLSELKIGSRPSRRTTEISVEGLRAIPWVLCWTQTRTLFPTWWGVGSTWSELSPKERRALKLAYENEPVFTSYVKALGFTIAKVELPVFRMYLDASGLPSALVERTHEEFTTELAQARRMVKYLSGSDQLIWARPWLGASIRLRAPMIHPLNLLQVLAVEDRDFGLFRTCATGISAGMMSTG